MTMLNAIATLGLLSSFVTKTFAVGFKDIFAAVEIQLIFILQLTDWKLEIAYFIKVGSCNKLYKLQPLDILELKILVTKIFHSLTILNTGDYLTMTLYLTL